MGLRKITILIVSLTVAGLMLCLFVSSRFIFLNKFEILEDEMVRRNIIRSRNFLADRIERIGFLTADWANWDDAVHFVATGDAAFIESNLTLETLLTQKLNAVVFYDLGGKQIWGGFIDPVSKDWAEPPAWLGDLFRPDSGFLPTRPDQFIARQGLAMTESGPLMLAVHPIRDSNAAGPVRGAVVMAQLLDRDMILRLAELTRADLDILSTAFAPPPPEALEGFRETLGREELAVAPIDDHSVRGYGLIRDIRGEPAFYLTVSMFRGVYRQGLEMIGYNLFLILAAGVVLLVAILSFLERNILSRLALLGMQARAIGRGETQKRVDVGGRDELSALAGALNAMLARLGEIQKALEISERRHRTLFMNIGAAALVARDQDGRIELVNEESQRLLDLPADSEPDASWVAIIHPLDRALAMAHHAARLARDPAAPGAVDCRFRKKGGGEGHATLRVTPLAESGTSIVSLIDLTERKRAEDALAEFNRNLEELVAERTFQLEAKAVELEDANRRLLELDRLKSAFLSSVSHELRTPLTSIRGFARLIAKDFARLELETAGLPERSTRNLSRIDSNLAIIVKESDRLTMLINDFLDLSKIESGHMEWRDEAVDVTGLVDEAVEAVGALYEKKPDVRLVIQTQAGLPLLYVDPDRLHQVLLNLLGNAAKFTNRGEVAVAAFIDPDGDLRLQVKDEGPGVAANDLESIFEKFHQSSGGDMLEDKPKGTGLGLAICKTIVEHYGGRVWAESELGRGSVFQVKLPGRLLMRRGRRDA